MQSSRRKILFSVDLEEFDIPEEHGTRLPLDTKLSVSLEGMCNLQCLMQQHQATATLFTTAFWASQHTDYVRELAQQHEIASHTFYHDRFEPGDLQRSRKLLSDISGQDVQGLRMPLMQDIDHKAVKDAGYTYDSSLHPTWIPGRYNHLRSPRQLFHNKEGLWILPASVTPVLRIPVFWLALKNLPLSIYKSLCRQILAKDGYVVLYVHPWEFTDLSRFKLPLLTRRIDGPALTDRLGQLFRYLQDQGASFETHGRFIAGQRTDMDHPHTDSTEHITARPRPLQER